MLKKLNCIAFALIVLMCSSSTLARGIYQTDDEFLSEVFDAEIPDSRVIWLDSDMRKAITEVIGHQYPGFRVQYWQKNGRKAWILEEIGKEQPITFGIVVSERKVEGIKVLAFRESRGDEIRQPNFTQQFENAGLQENRLSQQIDGIVGATLSVRAMKNTVRLALYLDSLLPE